MSKSFNKLIRILILIFVNLLYSTVGIFTKLASQQTFLSAKYIYSFCCVFIIIGVYAILWQQIIKNISLSFAYVFKGTTIIFTMLFANWIFNESITTNNIIGSLIIFVAIALFAKSDKEVSK